VARMSSVSRRDQSDTGVLCELATAAGVDSRERLAMAYSWPGRYLFQMSVAAAPDPSGALRQLLTPLDNVFPGH